MKAIYKKELRSYLTSMIGYVFIAFILLLLGIYFTAINIQQAYPEIGYALGNTSFVFLIAVPVLTMRVLAEEQKNRTDQMLLTAPVGIGSIVMGKYLALLTVFGIPMAVICLYPLVLAQHGTISFAMSYTSVFGFFLLGAAYIAIGVFLSSVTESQVIAAVISFIVLFVSYVEEGIAGFFPESAEGSLFAFMAVILLVCVWIGSMIKNPVVTGVLFVVFEAGLVILYFVKSSLLEGKIQEFLSIFNLTGHLNNFIYGIFDLNGIVYYLSVIVLCVFFTVQSLQKRRWN